MGTQELFMGCNTSTLKAHRTALLAEAALVDDILKDRVEPNDEPARLAQHVEATNGAGPEGVERNAIVPACLTIALLAHRLWLERGCPTGSDQDDWFMAERSLKINPRTTPETVA